MPRKNSTKKTRTKRVKVHAAEVIPAPTPEAPAAETTAPQADAPGAETPAAAPTVAKGKKTPKAKTEPTERKPGILTIAADILKDSKKAMTTKEIVEQALSKGLWETKGKSPGATLYSAVIREIANKGSESRFMRSETKGTFCASGK